MKHMKMAIVCIAAAAFFLVAGAGSASAAVLCKENIAHCEGSKIYKAPTQLTGGTVSNMLFETAGGALLDECSGHSTFKAKTSNDGGAGDAVKAPVTEWIWDPKCTKTTKTVANGEFTIDSTNTNGDGTLTLHGFEVTLLLLAGNCVYGSNTKPDIGTIFGGKTAEASINVLLERISGGNFCPPEARWKVIYSFTEPAAPLWVEPGV
jgi:hypothetical protein